MRDKKGLLIIGLFLLIMVLSQTGCAGSQRIDLASFATIRISGYDGKATASLLINWNAFEEAVRTVTNNEVNTVAYYSIIQELEESISYSLDKTEELSNGDSITLHVEWSDDIAKKYHLRFYAESISIEVSDLDPLVVLDLFADVFIDFEGVAPEAKAMIRNASTDAYIKTISYSADNTAKLRNGDTIIVTANTTREEEEMRGYTFAEIQKSFTVEGIDEYIVAYSSIDKETFEKMDKQARDVITSALASRGYSFTKTIYPNTTHDFLWEDTVVGRSFQLMEVNLKCSYFFVLKDGIAKAYNDVNNSIYMIYEVSFTTEYTSKEDEVDIVYLPIFYSDFIKRDRGNIDVRITDASIRNKNESFDNVFRDVVESNKARYEYEEIVY